MGQLLALPHMFKTTVTTTSTSNSNNGEDNVKNSTTSKGMQKLSEVYNEYKVKGLIDNNLPVVILQDWDELNYNLEEKLKIWYNKYYHLTLINNIYPKLTFNYWLNQSIHPDSKS